MIMQNNYIMKKITSLLLFIAIAIFANAQDKPAAELKGAIMDGNLVFTFENNSGKIIANCDFKLQLPEGISIKQNSKKTKYLYEEGDATEGMTYSVKFLNDKYTIVIYDGEFDESAGNTIISLPLQGEEIKGTATISNIAFGDSEGNNISRPSDFTIILGESTPSGSVNMEGKVKDGNLVFTFTNTTGKTISNCNFQFALPEGMSLIPDGTTYQYIKGDATAALTYAVTFSNNKYSIKLTGGKFNETAGNTIISLPLQGKTGGKATVSNISFGDVNDNIIGKPEDFNMDIPAIDNGDDETGSIELKGEFKDGKLIFTYENTTGKTIANCDFKLQLPEGTSIKQNSKKTKYMYEEGDATEGMTFSIKFTNDKYSIVIYDGEFDETAGNIVITLPLEGEMDGEAVVSNVAFGDPDGNNINRSDGFSINITPTNYGSVELKGEVQDGSLVFTFENTTDKSIGNCSFQLTLPEGMSLTPNGGTYQYVKGDATQNMSFSIAASSNLYTITINNGEFSKTAGTIISLPMQGALGGEATVNNISFGDTNGTIIERPKGFAMNIPSTVNGSIILKGDVKNGNLVFTYENTTGKTIGNCNFQLVLPEGMSLVLSGNKYLFEKGNATASMTFSVTYNSNQYNITINEGQFDDAAGNTIITLPLEGKSGGRATVSNVSFSDANGFLISKPAGFNMDIPATEPDYDNESVVLTGEFKDNSLVFRYRNNSGKNIANCNFQLELPDGMEIKKNSTGKKYLYEEGDATEGMTFSIKYSNNKYTITVYDGEFDDAAGNTIISLPLQGEVLTGPVVVSNIAFGDLDGNNISRPKDYIIEKAIVIPTGSAELKGEVKDGSLIFTFENTSGMIIGNCNFQFVLPEGISIKKNSSGNKYQYERGDATKGLTFSITSNDNRYTVAVYGGEFNETAGNTIISLPLQGKTGGKTTVSNILFATSEGNLISRPDGFTMDIPAAISNNVELKGEVKDGNLIFSFANPSGNAIANCNFQFELPKDVTVKRDPISEKCKYGEGDATAGMTFYIASNDNKYTVIVYGGELKTTAGNTIISIPLQGEPGGKATVSNITFANSEGKTISSPESFTVDITSVNNNNDNASVNLKGEVKDGNLIFTFENNTGKTIANCNFQFELPEDVTVMYDETENQYIYNVGSATTDMVLHVAFKNNKYIVEVYDGEFNATAGSTIISLPLKGKTGGKATVSEIAFGDKNGNIISRPDGFTLDISSVCDEGNNGSIELKSEVKDGNLIFSFENTTEKTIGNCSFQFKLPEGLSVMLNSTGKKYLYEKGDATAGMTFSVTFKNNKYAVTVYGGEFDEEAGNTIISLPLEGNTGGKATISEAMFANSEGKILSLPENFTIDIPVISTGSVDLKAEIIDGNMVFSYANNSGKTIATCDFKLQLPEGISIQQNSKKTKYLFKEGDATEGMTFAIKFANDKYTIVIYDGEFDETAGNTIISLPLQGRPSGKATVSNIAFGDLDGNNISRPKDFTIDVPAITTGSVDLKGEVVDGSLIFAFENTSGKEIANCNFQFELPMGLTLISNGNSYLYEEGNATAGRTFSVAFKNNKYNVTVYGGVFDETIGNTIISLPLKGKSGGKATVSSIAFGSSDGSNIGSPEGFGIDLPMATYGIDLKGEVKDGNLVFTFENNTGKTIANCNFQFELPEGISIKKSGKKYLYEVGDAAAGMTFYVTFNNNKYTVAAFGGEFNETAGNTIISLALQGRSGGNASVSNIAFGDSNGNNISRTEDFTMNIPSAINGGVDLKGKVKDGNLVFTFDNRNGATIANCNFQFDLPEGVSIKRNAISDKCKYEEGDATEGLTFYIASNNNHYTVAVFGGEFDEKAGNTIVSLPLEGVMAGEVSVSNIAFGDSDGYNISRPEGFAMTITGVGLQAKVIDGHLVFTYDNNSGKSIGTCTFQFGLPEGVFLTTSSSAYTKEERNAIRARRLAPAANTFEYEAGDATNGMTFDISFDEQTNKYTVTVSGGEFNEDAGNTLVSLPLDGKSGGEAVINDIEFGSSDGETISTSEEVTIDVVGIEMKGEIVDGNLIFTFVDHDSKSIGNCNFQFELPEGLTLTPNGNKYVFEKGDATEKMTFSISLNDNKYSVTVYDGLFNKSEGTIISLPLQGKSGGKTTVSSISFGDSEGYISSLEDLCVDIPAAAYGIDMKAEMKDGNLIITFDNYSGKTIGKCNFQLVLPEGVSIKKNLADKKFQFEKGNATEAMTFSIAFSNNVYIVTISDGEFNETAGHTIITLPLQGNSGGDATVSDIIFGGSDGNNISHPEDISVEVTGLGLKGDVNGDGSVDGMDVVAIYNIMLGKNDKTDAADVNGDDSIDGMDVVSIYNIMLGK